MSELSNMISSLTPRRLAADSRRMARRLELRSFPLLQEQFSAEEGLRAGLAIALPLAAALLSGQRWLSWAVFAAFWTCLCDAPGPHGLRRKLLAGFALGGTLVAFVGSWAANCTALAALLTAPLLILLIVSLTGLIQYANALGTLLAVVTVVAVGFPRAPAMAALQAAAFLGGAAWAWGLINVVWRIDDREALHKAASAAVLRMIDMSHALLCSPQASYREQTWHPGYGEHRRAVRLALERLRAMLQRYANATEAGSVPAAHLMESCEMMFSVLIALEHTAIEQMATAAQRRRVARLACAVLLRAHRRLDMLTDDVADPDRKSCSPLRISAELPDPVLAGCQRSLQQAHALLLQDPRVAAPAPARAGAELPGTASPQPWRARLANSLRQGGRQAAGVAAVFYAARVLHLGYPYWATMAVVVVLQGPARLTWTRCLERILGSFVGAMCALVLLHFIRDAQSVLLVIALVLAGLAIALRLVNYTVFVVFLTMLFICVTEMLQPGVGIASARAVDNLIGSAAALLAALGLWPDLGASPRQRIADGLKANRAYLEAVVARQAVPVLRRLQRQAGVASIDAETALHDLGGLCRHVEGLTESEMTSLRELRDLAGSASVEWHRQQA